MELRIQCWPRRIAALCLTTVLAACGGGSSDENAPPSATKIALTATNALPAAAMTFAYPELMLQLAQLTVDWTDSLASSGQASLALDCGPAGSLRLSHQDANGNGQVDGGDSLQVAADGCASDLLQETLDGHLAIELTQRTGTLLVGVMKFSADSRLAASPEAPTDLQGELPFHWSADEFGHTLQAGQGTHSFALHGTVEGQAITESLGLLHVSRSVRRDTAQITFDARGVIDSNLLGGQFDVSTSLPMRGRLRELPFDGAFTLGGEGLSSVRLLARDVNSSVLVELLDGSGSVIGSAEVSYEDISVGFLWWPTGVLPVPAEGYAIQPVQHQLQLVAQPAFDAMRPLPGTLTWQFNGPITTPGLRALFSEAADNFGRYFEGTMRIDGAWIRVTLPDRQLTPGGAYLFKWSDSLQSTGLFEVTLPVQPFTVLDTVSAAIAPPDFAALIGPGDLMLLDGSASRTIDDTTQLQWRQLSGPPLVFADPQGATTAVHLAGTGLGDTAVVELTVSNAAGEIATQQLTLQTVPDPGRALYLVQRFPASAAAVLDIDTHDAEPNYLSESKILDVIVSPGQGGFERFLIQFSATPMAGQHYLFGGVGNGGISSMVFVASAAGTCATNQGSYQGSLDLREYSQGPGGDITALAFEVEGECDGQPHRASLRYHSQLAPAAAEPDQAP